MVSVGATVLGALFGRKAITASTLGRATTAVRGVGRSVKESQDVGLAQQRLVEAQNELKALNDELAEEVAALGATDAASIDVQTIEVKPKRGGVDVRLVALAWKPVE
jgi:multidrug resistance efflux pump